MLYQMFLVVLAEEHCLFIPLLLTGTCWLGYQECFVISYSLHISSTSHLFSQIYQVWWFKYPNLKNSKPESEWEGYYCVIFQLVILSHPALTAPGVSLKNELASSLLSRFPISFLQSLRRCCWEIISDWMELPWTNYTSSIQDTNNAGFCM